MSKQTGFEAKRVSPKNRNPAGVPPAWEAEAEYPLDKATGYAPGMVRGVVSIQRAL